MFHDIRDLENTKYSERYKLRSFMSFNEFKEKLKYLSKEYNIVNSSEIQSLKTSKSKHAVLTFDDGLLDHYHVAQLLSDMKLSGTFLVPTQAVRDRVLMRTHKIQFLLASISEKLLVERILGLIKDSCSINLWEKYSKTKWQDNWWTSEMIFVTNILRYYDDGSITDNLFRDINVKFKKLKGYSLNRGTVERWADEYYTDSLPKTFGDEELEDLQSYLDRKYKLQGRGGYINFFGDDESIYDAEAPARNRVAQRELERKAMRYIEDNNIDLDKIYPDED